MGDCVQLAVVVLPQHIAGEPYLLFGMDKTSPAFRLYWSVDRRAATFSIHAGGRTHVQAVYLNHSSDTLAPCLQDCMTSSSDPQDLNSPRCLTSLKEDFRHLSG